MRSTRGDAETQRSAASARWSAYPIMSGKSCASMTRPRYRSEEVLLLGEL